MIQWANRVTDLHCKRSICAQSKFNCPDVLVPGVLHVYGRVTAYSALMPSLKCNAM